MLLIIQFHWYRKSQYQLHEVILTSTILMEGILKGLKTHILRLIKQMDKSGEKLAVSTWERPGNYYGISILMLCSSFQAFLRLFVIPFSTCLFIYIYVTFQVFLLSLHFEIRSSYYITLVLLIKGISRSWYWYIKRNCIYNLLLNTYF